MTQTTCDECGHVFGPGEVCWKISTSARSDQGGNVYHHDTDLCGECYLEIGDALCDAPTLPGWIARVLIGLHEFVLPPMAGLTPEERHRKTSAMYAEAAARKANRKGADMK